MNTIHTLLHTVSPVSLSQRHRQDTFQHYHHHHSKTKQEDEEDDFDDILAHQAVLKSKALCVEKDHQIQEWETLMNSIEDLLGEMQLHDGEKDYYGDGYIQGMLRSDGGMEYAPMRKRWPFYFRPVISDTRYDLRHSGISKVPMTLNGRKYTVYFTGDGGGSSPSNGSKIQSSQSPRMLKRIKSRLDYGNLKGIFRKREDAVMGGLLW